jgi:DNA polymerase (family 10)
MTNHAIARAFTLLADLLEIQEENIYKVRAYRKAAEAIEGMTENLEGIAARGELESIPGIGKAIAAKVTELCSSGRMRALEEARSRTPEGLAELMALPGFGPRKAQLLYERLGVESLEDLENQTRAGRLAIVTGLGVGTDESVLAKIEAHRRRGSRWPIGRALPYAEALARALRDTGACRAVAVAGSIRRMAETVGDINLVATAHDLGAARAAFTALGEIGELTEEASGHLRARAQAGPTVTLWLSGPEEYGARLRAATGSAAHNEQLVALAQSRGFRFDDGGTLYRLESGDRVAGAEEADLFRALGLPWIAPELREGRGEVEAAAAGGLPALVTAEDIRGILHCHSEWSDGSAPIAVMAATARGLGQQYMAMTDHSRALGVARGLDETRLREQMGDIDRLNAETPDGFRILKGIEVDILADGSLDLPEELLRELDIVIGSVHSHFRQDPETITRRMVAALESGCVDIVAHPTGRILGARDPYAVDVGRLIEAAARTGAALEINAHPERLDLNDVHARQASLAGVPISINTDAHHPDHLSLLLYGIATARRAWLEPQKVINTWPLEQLREWISRRRGRTHA